MSTQPNDIGFTPEELNSFASIEPPETAGEPEKPQGLSAEEARLLIDQSTRDMRQETTYLRGQLDALRQTPRTPEVPPTTSDGVEIPIKFNKDEHAVVDVNALNQYVEQRVNSRLEDYHRENIEPYRPAVQNIQEQRAIDLAVETVKREAPELLQGQDERFIGKLALDFFSSNFNPYGDEAGRTQYAFDQIRQLTKAGGGKPAQDPNRPLATGDIMRQASPVYNQTGRTNSGSEGAVTNPFGYPRGATVKLTPKSINDLGGIEAAQEYARWQNNLREYNRANNMGWNIVEN